MGNGLSRTNYIALDYNDLKETNLNDYAQLACALRNSYIESVSDEYFGKAEKMLNPNDVVTNSFIYQEGTEDGWQVRRHQKTAYAIIALGCKGTIAGFDIDTTGFMETSPSHVTVEGYVENQTEGKWITLLPNVSIQMNSHNFFKIEHDLHIYSRLKLTTAPGGGIARFRCYGQVFPVWSDLNHEYNLASANLGAQIVRWTDVQHCNKPNILLDNGFLTSNGWLTPRSRMEPRNDFVVIQLAAPGYISAIVMDTSGFEGNTPHSFVVDGCHSQEVDPYVDVNTEWVTLVEKTPCVLNNKAIHFVTYGPPVSHIRLTIYPDGGIQQILALGAPYLPEIQNISNENIMKEETRDQVAEEELNAQITREISDLVCPKTTLIEKTTLITKKRRSTELKESPVVKKPLNEPKKMKYKKDVYKTRTSVQSSL